MTAVTATLSITEDAATDLLDWVGNNGIDSDVNLYTGGCTPTGDYCFGFTADVLPTKGAIAETLVRAAKMVKSRQDGSFVNFLATDPTAMDVLIANIGIHDGYSAVQIVMWNVRLLEN